MVNAAPYTRRSYREMNSSTASGSPNAMHASSASSEIDSEIRGTDHRCRPRVRLLMRSIWLSRAPGRCHGIPALDVDTVHVSRRRIAREVVQQVTIVGDLTVSSAELAGVDAAGNRERRGGRA